MTDAEQEKHAARAAAIMACNEYKDKTDSHRGYIPFHKEKTWAYDETFSSQVAKRLSDVFLTHIFKYTSELKIRVQRLNAKWARSEIGRSIVDSIGDNGQTTQDKISIHYILNMVLPPTAQIVLIPETGFKDQFIDITERQLVSVLYTKYAGRHSTGTTTSSVVNIDIDSVMESSSAVTGNDKSSDDVAAMKSILKKMLGSKTKAQLNTQDNVGHLFYHLFLTGTNTNNIYKRGTNVLSSVNNNESNPCLLNDSKRSLAGLLFLDQEDQARINTIANAMRPISAKDPNYAALKAVFKTMVKTAIKNPDKYKARNASMEPKVTRQKFVLSGNLGTDGIVLKLLSYKLTEGKGPATQLPAPAPSPALSPPTSSVSSAPLGPTTATEHPEMTLNPWVMGQSANTGSTSSSSTWSTSSQDLDPLPNLSILSHTSPPSELRPAVSQSALISMAPGPSIPSNVSTAPPDTPPSITSLSISEQTPPPPTMQQGTTATLPSAAFPWSTGPRIKGLPYLSERFDSPETLDGIIVRGGIKQGVRTLCLDLGVASTATAVLTHSDYPDNAFNLHIPRGPRDVIDRRYRKEQTRQKKAKGIEEIEGRLVPLARVQMDGQDFAQALEVRR
ncbi:hypothetical protein BGZ83_003345, partial [Gryganskiella cystojenkinii]